jgi:hypothetical protein
MKTLIFTALFFTTMYGTAQAQQPRDYKQQAVRNYTWNFTNGNQGVIESSFETVLEFREAYPEGDFKPVIRSLKKLSKVGANESIRTKAILVAAALENPDMKVTELLLTMNH